MDLPLELNRLDWLRLRTTPDNSRTQLVLETAPENGDGRTHLDVTDVQELAGALLQWLADHGHDMPDLPLNADLQPIMDEDVDGLPPVQDPPPLTQFGQLEVWRDQPGNRIRIEKADPWVLADGDLLEQLLTPATPWVEVDGLHLTVRDSDGTVVRYLVRTDVLTAGGQVALQQISYGRNQPDVSAVPGR